MLDLKQMKDKINRLRWGNVWLSYRTSLSRLLSVSRMFREEVEALGLVLTLVWISMEIQTPQETQAMHLVMPVTTPTIQLTTELIALESIPGLTILLSIDLFQIIWKRVGKQTLLIEVLKELPALAVIMLVLIAFCPLTTFHPIYAASKVHQIQEFHQQKDVKKELRLAAMDPTTGSLPTLVSSSSSNLLLRIVVHQVHAYTQMFSQGCLIQLQGWPVTDLNLLTIYQLSDELALK